MSPQTRRAITIAAAATGFAAVAGIAIVQGWVASEHFSRDVSPKPRAAATATAPAESLSPGESLVAEQGSLPKPAPPKSEARPAEPPPAPKVAPAPKPQPQTPAYNRSPRCPSCGVVSSTTYRAYRREAGDAWEIRIKLDSGTRRVVRFANDPGFRAGDRIRWKDGRLTRE